MIRRKNGIIVVDNMPKSMRHYAESRKHRGSHKKMCFKKVSGTFVDMSKNKKGCIESIVFPYSLCKVNNLLAQGWTLNEQYTVD